MRAVMRPVVIARTLRGAIAALTWAAMASASGAVGASDAGPAPVAVPPQQSVAEQVQRHQGEIDACYRRVLDTHPGLAGQIVVHFTVTARGTVSQAVVKESTLGNREVEDCIVASVERWRFVPPENAQDTHVSVPFDLRPQSAAEQIHPIPGLVARHVLERSAVGYSRLRGLVVFNRCWTPTVTAGAPGGEGCVVVLSPLSAGRPTQEIPVFKPGEAPDDKSRRKKETAAWPRVLAGMKEGAFVELSRTDWPADSPDLILSPMGLALHFGRHSLKVTRAGSRADVIGQIKTGSGTSQARPIAAFSNPAERVVVVAITDQMMEGRPNGGPEAKAKAKTKVTPSVEAGAAPGPGTVTTFEVIDVLR
jgi:TonB family protein